MRPEKDEAKAEAEAKTYEAEAEATKFGLEAVLASAIEDLTSLENIQSQTTQTLWLSEWRDSDSRSSQNVHRTTQYYYANATPWC